MNDRSRRLPKRAGRRWQVLPRAAALGLCASLLAPDAGAQTHSSPQQKAVAEALFDEASKLMEEGQFGAACERFEQSQKVAPGVGTLLNLGRCYALTGRLASAWAIFREAESAARASGQGERARVAEEDARDLRPRLSELALLVTPGQPRGFELLMDGDLVSSVQYGLSVPVDAGQHTILARAPGYAQWSTTIQIGGGAERKSLQVAALEPMALEAAPNLAPPAPAAASDRVPPAALAAPSAGVASGSAVDEAVTQASSTQRVTGLWVAGGGVFAIAAGVATGVHAKSLDDDAKQLCEPAGCPTTAGADMNRSARHWAAAANVLYVVGAAALGTGAYLYLSAPSQSSKAPKSSAWHVVPMLGNGAGALLDGKF